MLESVASTQMQRKEEIKEGEKDENKDWVTEENRNHRCLV